MMGPATRSLPQVSQLSGLPQQLAELTAAHDKLKYDASVAQGRFAGANDRIAR